MSLAELFANQDLIDNQGNPVPLSTLADKEKIGLYFSASWCPPCRMFTPNLAKVYQEWKNAGKSIELVLVSSDRDASDMKEYHKKMPWLAVPFRGAAHKSISERFTPSGIPALYIVDKEGNEISDEGRSDIQLKGAAAYDEWQ
ncbi:hypothetical protein GEMRC1_002316 [Eukaryota sp. GEM-RC1]